MVKNHFCQVVGSFNAQDIYGPEQNEAFEEAVQFARRYVQNLARIDTLARNQRELAEKTHITNLVGVNIAIPHPTWDYIPVKNYIGNADVVVSWDEGQSAWTVQMVPENEGSFGSKYSLESSSREDEIFCHKAGFIGKYRPHLYNTGDAEGEWIAFKLKGQNTVFLTVTQRQLD